MVITVSKREVIEMVGVDPARVYMRQVCMVMERLRSKVRVRVMAMVIGNDYNGC